MLKRKAKRRPCVAMSFHREWVALEGWLVGQRGSQPTWWALGVVTGPARQGPSTEGPSRAPQPWRVKGEVGR